MTLELIGYTKHIAKQNEPQNQRSSDICLECVSFLSHQCVEVMNPALLRSLGRHHTCSCRKGCWLNHCFQLKNEEKRNFLPSCSRSTNANQYRIHFQKENTLQRESYQLLSYHSQAIEETDGQGLISIAHVMYSVETIRMLMY